MKLRGLTSILLVALLAVSNTFAQTAVGSIVGVVLDPSGKAMPNAQITLLNKATNQPTRTFSNDLGYYSFPQVQPATYQITVQADGFKVFIQDNVQLDVGMTLTVNPNMQIGELIQSVTVTGELPLLESQTSSLGQVIESKAIVDLPLDGRNAYGFATQVPGVVAPYSFSQTQFDEYGDQFVSINGSRPNQNLFLLDGGINSEPAFAGPGYFPIVDDVQEYKVQTNNLGAEFSNTGGGAVNVITKSGSNDIHGSAWEFYRGTALSANDFFSNRAGLPKAQFLFHQFGATLGGPLRKDKTFFFFAYEGVRWSQSGSAVGTVPTADQRAGDFSKTFDSNGNLIPIYDPFSTVPDPSNPGQYLRTQYPGNKIPTDKINPVAASVLTYLPLPNHAGDPLTGTNNFYTNFSSPISENSFSLRIDHSLTDTQKLFVRYSINDTNHDYPSLYGPKFATASPDPKNDFYREQQATVDYTNAFRSNMMLDLNSSYIRYFIGRSNFSSNINPTVVGLPSYFNTLAKSYPPCFPLVNVSGLQVTPSGVGLDPGFIGGGCYVLGDVYPDLREYGNLTIVHGSHTFKVGADFGMVWLSSPRNEPAGPNFSFGPEFTQGPNPITATGTGLGLASFLAGTGSGFTSSGGTNQYLSSKYFGGYFQDNWRVTPKFTLNLGIRYDFTSPWVERKNRFTDWSSTAISPLQVPSLGPLHGGLEYPGVNGVPRSEFDPQYNEVQPRLGFAYAATPTMTIRGGYGLFFAPLNGAGFNGWAVPNSGFVASTNWVSTLDGVTPLNTLADPFPQGFVYPTGSSQGLSTQLGQSVVGTQRYRPVSYTEQWNFDIQKSLGTQFLFDVAYAGSHGVHLYGDYNPDQLPDKYLALGSSLNDQVENPFYGLIATGDLSGPTVARSQLLTPFPQFSGVTLGNASFFGASSYNALQAKLEKRFSHGYSLLAAYTFSKLLDNLPSSETGFGGNFGYTGIQDWYNLRGEWAVADFDTPHTFTFNGLYELPFGPNKRFLNHNAIAKYLFGSWQLSGLTTFTSGAPQEVLTAVNTLFNHGGSQRANWNGHNPSLGGKVSKRLDHYFNVSDFSQPAPFTYGNSPRNLGILRAPQFISTDFSAIKRFPVRERVTGEFRAEAFNLFNHPFFGPPDTMLGDGNTGVISSQTNNPRQIQLAVKVLW